MVDVVKWTFTAARISWASARVIQSPALGIGQSPAELELALAPAPAPELLVDDDAPSVAVAVPLVAPDSVADDPVVAALASVPVDLLAPADAVARRSFFAQPEPLKWMAGGANAFFTGPPPHVGQVDGPSACTPWTASKRVPHAAQS